MNENANPPSAEDALRALALRLIAPRHGIVGADAGEPELLVGQIPASLPIAVPLPDDARVLGSMIHGTSATIVLDTDWPSARVLGFYRERLAAAGWTVPPPVGPRGGFVPSDGMDQMYVQFCQTGQDSSLSVTAAESADLPTQLQITFDTYENYPERSPCSQRYHRPRAWETLPTLVPPPGATQHPGSAGSSGEEVHSTARLETPLDLSAIGAHYAAQLAHAGWARTGDGTSGPVAWSTWTLADEEGKPWCGLFLAIRRDDSGGRYALTLNAERADTPGGGRSGTHATRRIMLRGGDSGPKRVRF